MGKMVIQGSKYTDEQRHQAIVMYAVLGTGARVSRETGISEQTLSDWRKQEWWIEGLEEVRSAKQDEHINAYHELTKKALDKADRGIEALGDDLSASDIKALVVAGATATDKGRLLMNQPTSISSKSTDMSALADEFRKVSKQWDEKQIGVVSVQLSVDSEEKSVE